MSATGRFAPSREAVRALLEAGIRAPSADNHHHVRFVVDDDGFTVRADRSFLDGDVVHRRLLILVSYGAVVENIRLASTRLGHSFAPRWFPDAEDPAVVAVVKWADAEPVAHADPLAAFIDDRHTNRRFYRGPPMTDDDRAAVEAAVPPGRDVGLTWCDDPPRRRALAGLIRFAETRRFDTPFLHRELFDSIAFDAGWRATVAEGLAPGSLEVERPLRPLFAALRHWPAMRIVNRVALAHRILGFRAGWLPARTSPHLGVLHAARPSDAAALAVGAAFQRLWLAAESRGLALQPMVASAILLADVDGRHGVTADMRDTLRRGWVPIVGNAVPYVVFRLGRARRPGIRSGRKPIDSYLL